MLAGIPILEWKVGHKFVIETNIKLKSKAFLHKCEPNSQKRESNQQMEKGKNSGFEGIKELFYINLDP